MVPGFVLQGPLLRQQANNFKLALVKVVFKLKGDASNDVSPFFFIKADNANAIENLEKFLEIEPDSERSANVKNIIAYLKKDGGF